jgi:type II secretory pathway pseudopilin PulG
MSTEPLSVDGVPQGEGDEQRAEEERGRDARRLPLRRVVISIAAILVAAILLGWTYAQDDHQSAQIDALYAALGDSQSQIEDLGGDPVAPAPEELLEDPSYSPQPGPSGPPGPPGPALTEAEIEAAFADYFAAHPYEFEPSAAQLTAAFASVLTEHPDLLNDQLYAAMAAYLAENPPPPGPPGPAGENGEDGADGTDGQDGAQGEPGRPPTKEEIRAEIEAYIDEHGLPCPPEAPAGPLTVVTPSGPVNIIACIPTDQGETPPD